MKDNYGTTLEVEHLVIVNVGGVLHQGRIVELKDKGNFPVRVRVLKPSNYPYNHNKMPTGHIVKTTENGVIVV